MKKPFIMGMVTLMGLLQGACAPRINDISTDVNNPPVFKTLREGKRQTYPPKNAEKQSNYYKDLAPLILREAPEVVFKKVLAVAKAMSWDVVAAVPEEGRIEAVDTTLIFRFKDDIVVRIAAEGARSRVDVRSASRVGQGDLGKNASRIRDFLDRLQKAL